MIDIRIGNDIPIVWSFYTKDEDGQRIPYNLEGRDVRIVMTNQFGKRVEVSHTVLGNSAYWTFRGKDQKFSGPYTCTFFENFGENGMKALDKIQPFRLVHEQEVVERGTIEGCCSCMEVAPITLESELPETMSYETLTDLPKINHVILIGDKTLAELGIASAEDLQGEIQRAQGSEQSLQNTINAESQRAQNAETGLLQGLAAETQRATAKEAELEAEIAQQGKVDDVKVDDISVVEGKIAKIYTRIKGFGVGAKLTLELSHFLSYSGNKISITNPYAHTDATNHKILI